MIEMLKRLTATCSTRLSSFALSTFAIANPGLVAVDTYRPTTARQRTTSTKGFGHLEQRVSFFGHQGVGQSWQLS